MADFLSLGGEGKTWIRFCVGDGEGDGDGDGDGERLSKFFSAFLIGSGAAGNVSLICGDLSAGSDGVSSIFVQ